MSVVLVVDDEKSIRVTFQEFLRAEGHEVYTAASAAEALDVLSDVQCDVVVADIILPEVSGIELLQKIRERYPYTKVLLITGEPAVDTAVEAVRAGAFDYLAKPVRRLDLCCVVRAAVRLKLAEDDRRRLQTENIQYQEHLEELVMERTMELAQKERYFRALIENAPDVIMIVEKAGIITYLSPAIERVLGYKPEDVLGESFFDYITPEEVQETKEVFKKLIEKPGSVEMLLRRSRHKDGTYRYLECRGANLTSDLTVRGIVISLQDVTERREAELRRAELEAQLIQSQKMEAIGRLAGGVAHDFNNLLTAIQGYAEIINLSIRVGDPIREDIQEILKAVSRASGLTQQLLAFSRKQIVTPKVMDLNTVLTDTEKMLGRLIGEDIELQFKLAPDLHHVVIDPHQMDQILINLAANGRDAMPSGGRLSFETANVELKEKDLLVHTGVDPGSYVRFSTRDTGKGISPADLPHIFEPFFTKKKDGEGIGLGLSTVYGIVKQHRGFVEVESRPGDTVFHIFLPATKQEPSSLVTQEIEIPLSGDETVLLVEDEESIRKFAKKILCRQGYNVIEASSSGDAYLLCEKRQHDIHLLLADVVLPHMNGRELYERCKLIYPKLRVLYMSGYAEDAIAQYGVFDMSSDFISKPFTISSLTQKVRKALDR